MLGMLRLLAITVMLLCINTAAVHAAVIDTLAGGLSGSMPALSTSVDNVNGIALDGTGNIFFSDGRHQLIRMIDTNGTATTIAGHGMHGFAGDEGPAAEAQIWSAVGIAVDSAGRIFFSSGSNERVRMIFKDSSRDPQSPDKYYITTVAGGGTAGSPDWGDGGLATSASLNTPNGVSVDGDGNIYVSDSGHSRIRKIDTSDPDYSNWTISTVAGGGSPPDGLGDGGPALDAALFYPRGIMVDDSGNIFIADYGNHRIRKVDTNGIMTTVAGDGARAFSGDGGPATAASLDNPLSVHVDQQGNIFISDHGNNRIRKVDTNGIIDSVFYRFMPVAVTLDQAGNMYFSSLNVHGVEKYDTEGVFTLLAGNGLVSFSGDGRPAKSASLWVAFRGSGR